ncbi:MAG TPA: FAD-dependent oxidoreductase, partial [Haloplasmataceae bacterium]
MIDKDLVIIGGGLGGYEAAIIASNKGLNVALIEKDEIGGTYLNHGYIPTKALYNSAFFSRNIKNCKELGFNIADFTIDFPTIQKQKQEIVNRLRSNIMMMLDKAKVEVIKGIASFKDENTIEVKCEENVLEISAEYFIIATGSEENIIPIEGYDLKRVLTSKELLNIEEIPKSLVVIGGGVIGVELATIFNELGSKVVIYENFDRLIPFLDTDISSRLEVYLKKIGIEVITYALV